MDEYLDSCKALNKSPHTITNYESDLKKFIKWFEITNGNQLHKADAQTVKTYQLFLENGGIVEKKSPKMKIFWLNILLFLRFKKKGEKFGVLKAHSIVQKPMGVNSRKRHLSSLKNFFEYLRQTRLDKSRKFKNNPVRSKIHNIRLKDVDIKHTKLLKFDDWLTLKENAWRTKDKLILSLLYYGGLRVSELTNLKYENFNPHKKTLEFYRKGGSFHSLSLERFDEVYTHLEFFFEQENRDKSGPLFINNFGRPLSVRSLYRHIMMLFKKSGISKEHGPHSFRKACATNMYKRTKDIIKVRNYLNHTDAKVTQTYIEI